MVESPYGTPILRSVPKIMTGSEIPLCSAMLVASDVIDMEGPYPVLGVEAVFTTIPSVKFPVKMNDMIIFANLVEWKGSLVFDLEVALDNPEDASLEYLLFERKVLFRARGPSLRPCYSAPAPEVFVERAGTFHFVLSHNASPFAHHHIQITQAPRTAEEKVLDIRENAGGMSIEARATDLAVDAENYKDDRGVKKRKPKS